MKCTFSDVKNMKLDERVYGDSTIYISGVPWKMFIDKQEQNGVEWLVFCCSCNNEDSSSNWSRKVKVEYRLLSGTEDASSVIKKGPNTYSNKGPVCGYVKFIKWEALTNEINGYLSPNGDLTLQLEIAVHLDSEE